MHRRCLLTLDNVTLIPPVQCTELLTTLDETTMDQACRALGYTTGC